MSHGNKNQPIDLHQPEAVVRHHQSSIGGLAHHELQYGYQQQPTSHQINDEMDHHNDFNQSSGDGDHHSQPIPIDQSYQVHHQHDQFVDCNQSNQQADPMEPEKPMVDQILESSSGHLDSVNRPFTPPTKVSII